MSEDVKTILIKRLKSLLWRLGIFAAVLVVGFVGDSIELFELSPKLATIIALILGEVTKYLNTQNYK